MPLLLVTDEFNGFRDLVQGRFKAAFSRRHLGFLSTSSAASPQIRRMDNILQSRRLFFFRLKTDAAFGSGGRFEELSYCLENHLDLRIVLTILTFKRLNLVS